MCYVNVVLLYPTVARETYDVLMTRHISWYSYQREYVQYVMYRRKCTVYVDSACDFGRENSKCCEFFAGREYTYIVFYCVVVTVSDICYPEHFLLVSLLKGYCILIVIVMLAFCWGVFSYDSDVREN